MTANSRQSKNVNLLEFIKVMFLEPFRIQARKTHHPYHID